MKKIYLYKSIKEIAIEVIYDCPENINFLKDTNNMLNKMSDEDIKELEELSKFLTI